MRVLYVLQAFVHPLRDEDPAYLDEAHAAAMVLNRTIHEGALTQERLNKALRMAKRRGLVIHTIQTTIH